MQLNINDMQLEIRKTPYNKTQVQEDGITHIVDTEHTYYAYQFGMAKNYFDVNTKEELISSLTLDLEAVIDELKQQIKTQEKQSEQETER